MTVQVPSQSSVLVLVCLLGLLVRAYTLVVPERLNDTAVSKLEWRDDGERIGEEKLLLPHGVRHEEERPRHMQQLWQQLKERDKATASHKAPVIVADVDVDVNAIAKHAEATLAATLTSNASGLENKPNLMRERFRTEKLQLSSRQEQHRHERAMWERNAFPTLRHQQHRFGAISKFKIAVDSGFVEAAPAPATVTHNRNAHDKDDNDGNGNGGGVGDGDGDGDGAGDVDVDDNFGWNLNNENGSGDIEFKPKHLHDRNRAFGEVTITHALKLRHSHAHRASERVFADFAKREVVPAIDRAYDGDARISLPLNSSFDDYYDSSGEEKETEWQSNNFPRSHSANKNGAATNTKINAKHFANPFDNDRAASRHSNSFALQEHSINADGLGHVRSRHERNGGGTHDDDSDVATAHRSSVKRSAIEREHHQKQLQHQRELQELIHNKNKFALAVPLKLSSNNSNKASGHHYTRGALTHQKGEELGTFLKHKHNKALASAHLKRMHNDGACRTPQRRVEHIQRDPSKIYTPHCTMLYRCAADTGCCRSERQTCAPKHTQAVDLYFYTKSINDQRGVIERLTFINHTECHCVEKSPQPAAEFHREGLHFTGVNESGFHASVIAHRASILSCNCPRLYEKILQDNNSCRCDCSSGNTDCDSLKRGMEHFSMVDRKCLLDGRCKSPTCKYGSYMKKYGRCPRRNEQLPITVDDQSLAL